MTDRMRDKAAQNGTGGAGAPDAAVPRGDAGAAIRDFAGSELFRRTFEEGMRMVEETAAYLDGPGRDQARALPRRGALAYAGESMRLTTRLMQVASWLLVQKAVLENEMTPAEAMVEKYRLGAKDISRGSRADAAELLPEPLLVLLQRSESLYFRVERLDEQLYGAGAEPPAGAKGQLDRLKAAFGNAG